VLIFGHLGAPALGVYGAGIATSLSRVACCLFLIAIVMGLRLERGGWTPWSRAALSWQGLREVIGHGAPVGAQLGLESSAFSLATLLAGRLGAESTSAHTIALNLASLSFMMPLGIAQAAVARVGNLVGARRFAEADRAAWVAVWFGALVMLGWAIAFLVLRDWLPRLYTADRTVHTLAAGILPIAAAFQIFDGVQVVAGGVLRGMGRTRPPAVCHAIGLWLVALPLATLLMTRADAGLEGLWWSLCLGLAVVALALVAWIRARGPRTLGPRPVDAAAQIVG
jgi:MATE family multidrug resistance protein